MIHFLTDSAHSSLEQSLRCNVFTIPPPCRTELAPNRCRREHYARLDMCRAVAIVALMSNKRQPTERVAVRAYNATHPAGAVILRHAHPWDQLLYASSGVMTVQTSAGLWVVPSHRSVWIPADVEHSIEM